MLRIQRGESLKIRLPLKVTDSDIDLVDLAANDVLWDPLLTLIFIAAS